MVQRRSLRATAGVALALAIGTAGPSVAGAPAGGFPAPDRPVASIVSPRWGEAPDRDAAHELAQITARLALRTGMSVADIGAGDGYDSLRLAQTLGPHGRVYAEDITPEYLNALRDHARRLGRTTVVATLGAPDNPRLAPGSIDAAIMVHMYHEITQPYALLYHLAPAFRPGGRLGIEELDRPTGSHGTPPALLTCELAAVGYRQLSLAPMAGGIGYFAVFTAPTAAERPAPGAIKACHA